MSETTVTPPSRVFCIGRNYGEHARELGNAVSEEPIVFLKPESCFIPDGAPIRIPQGIGRVDFEGELAVLIAIGGKHISETDAMAHVGAYSVYNDVTARDLQTAAKTNGHPWFRAKCLDTFGPLGPVWVPASQIPDPHALRLLTEVNGVTRQDGSTGDMIFRIPYLIAYLSRWFELQAGDVIATGTPAGVGPLVPGDTVRVTVEGVGTLTNPVEAEHAG